MKLVWQVKKTDSSKIRPFLQEIPYRVKLVADSG